MSGGRVGAKGTVAGLQWTQSGQKSVARGSEPRRDEPVFLGCRTERIPVWAQARVKMVRDGASRLELRGARPPQRRDSGGRGFESLQLHVWAGQRLFLRMERRPSCLWVDRKWTHSLVMSVRSGTRVKAVTWVDASASARRSRFRDGTYGVRVCRCADQRRETRFLRRVVLSGPPTRTLRIRGAGSPSPSRGCRASRSTTSATRGRTPARRPIVPGRADISLKPGLAAAPC